LGPLAQLVEQ